MLLCFEELPLSSTAVHDLLQRLQLPGLHCSLAIPAAHRTVGEFLEPMTDSEARETLGGQ